MTTERENELLREALTDIRAACMSPEKIHNVKPTAPVRALANRIYCVAHAALSVVQK